MTQKNRIHKPAVPVETGVKSFSFFMSLFLCLIPENCYLQKIFLRTTYY